MSRLSHMAHQYAWRSKSAASARRPVRAGLTKRASVLANVERCGPLNDRHTVLVPNPDAENARVDALAAGLNDIILADGQPELHFGKMEAAGRCAERLLDRLPNQIK